MSEAPRSCPKDWNSVENRSFMFESVNSRKTGASLTHIEKQKHIAEFIPIQFVDALSLSTHILLEQKCKMEYVSR